MTSRTINRGPAAAAGNRRRLLDAARRLFAREGYHVAFSAVAREAGVGQGSLYRHFPTRLDLALAVFEENLEELEVIAAAADPLRFTRLWRRIVEQTLESTAFVEMVVDARRHLPDVDVADRWRALLHAPLRDAQAAGAVPAELAVGDLALAVRMLYGVVVSQVEPARARSEARRALALIDPSLSWPQGRDAGRSEEEQR